MILTEASRENLAAEVAVHLGRAAADGSADPATVALARGHVETVAAYAHAYTFGRGFTVDVDGYYCDMAAGPCQFSYEVKDGALVAAP